MFVDTLRGKGSHKVESFIHPAIQLLPYTETQISSSDMMVPRWVLEFDGLRYLVMVLGKHHDSNSSLVFSWICNPPAPVRHSLDIGRKASRKDALRSCT